MAEELEVSFAVDKIMIKKLSLWFRDGKTIVQIIERRENSKGTDGWYPILFTIHDKYHDARLQFIGALAEIAYENANNSISTDRENIFVRGSLPLVRKNGAIK